jgi:hypothetical protein
MIITVAVAAITSDSELLWGTTRICFYSNFALNTTLVIARIRGQISPKNMDTATHLGLCLWFAGMYAIAFWCGKLDRKWPWITVGTVCSTLQILAIVFHHLSQWNYSPPEGCGTVKDIVPSETWNWIVGLTGSAVAIVSICAAVPTIRHRVSSQRIKHGTALIGVLGLIMILIMNEIGIIKPESFDKQFSVEAGEFGLGQIMAIVLVGVQVMGLVMHFLPEPSHPPNQGLELGDLGTQQRPLSFGT